LSRQKFYGRAPVVRFRGRNSQNKIAAAVSAGRMRARVFFMTNKSKNCRTCRRARKQLAGEAGNRPQARPQGLYFYNFTINII
jgi:hypothetical protein